ncbi:MAG: heme o synthase [Chloroflexota bacterium]|nr:heme o synthase [Chloroflexota bacterium]
MTRLYRLAVASVLSTFALIVFGNVTRVSDSGMGCADDWPRCQGKWYPPLELQPIIEYTHRTIAAYLGLLVLVVAVGTLLARSTRKRTKVTAWTAFGLVIFQALLGAVTVWRELPADVVTAHLGTAELFFGLTLLTAYFVAVDRGAPRWLVRAGDAPGMPRDRTFLRVAQAGALVIFLLILSGGATSTTGAALACDQWPLCRSGQVLPDQTSRFTWIHLGHRAVAVIGILAVAGVTLAALRRPIAAEVRRLAWIACGLIGVQSLIGAAYVISFGDAWLSSLHLAVATLLWATMVGIVVVARRTWEEEPGVLDVSSPTRRPVGGGTVSMPSQPVLQMSAQPAPTASGTQALRLNGSGTGAGVAFAAAYPRVTLPLPDLRRAGAVASDYVALTKPGILTLLLVTTLGAMLVAAEGIPPFGLVLATLIGGALAAGGANALNCYLDRDIDAIMPRTSRRATAAGRISPQAALTFGVTLTAVATLELGLLVNWLAAGLALAGNLYYVFVYTKWLKRTTPQNIVIGGAAGAVPPLVGWAAATGGLSPAAWVFFAVIFYWTPPHFWSLALLKQGEYGRVCIPMLPVVAGEQETRRQIVLYSVLLAAVALLLVPLGLGWLYLIATLALNGAFLGMAVRLYRAPSKRLARHLFMFSLWYLALIFAAAVADRLILA